MSDEHAGALVRRIARLAAGQAGGPPDRDLLRAFSERGDQAAFVALVDRHGGMVLRVCRRVLGCHHDAEDCFQAAFLVLARKAGSVRRGESLASWLHGVAYRIAMSAKRDIGRRRTHERKATELPAAARPAADPAGDVTWAEVRAALDDEIPRLPAAWRAPLVLCLLEGRSAAEAAGELGVTESAVRGRLHQAKQRLQARLARRGLTLSAALLAAGLASEAAAADAFPRSFAAATARAAAGFAAGSGAALGVSDVVIDLAKGALKTMAATKLVWVVGAVALSGMLALGGVWAAGGQPPGGGSAPAPVSGGVPERPAAAAPANAPANVPGAVPLRLDRPVEFHQKDGLSVLTVNSGTFRLTGESRLEATLKLSISPRVNVDEWIHVAVFDGSGRLLGTAAHKEAVSYTRLRVVPLMFEERKLDFGISKEFKNAALVVLTIGTPDLPAPAPPPKN